jgi:hypothetical protein
MLPTDDAQTALDLLRTAARRRSLVAFASVDDMRRAHRTGDGVLTLDEGDFGSADDARRALSAWS